MIEKYYCIVLTEDEMTGLKELCHRNRPYLSKYGQMIKDNVIDNPGYDYWDTTKAVLSPVDIKARQRDRAKREIAKAKDAVYAAAEQRIVSTGRLSISDLMTQSVPKNVYQIPTIPTGMIEYFAQDYWWKTSDTKRGTNGWIPIKEMHPEHALNAYLYMSTRGNQMYDMWHQLSFNRPSINSKGTKLGFVIESELAKAVYAQSKVKV